MKRFAQKHIVAAVFVIAVAMLGSGISRAAGEPSASILSEKDMEPIIQKNVIELRKIKVVYSRERRQQHAIETEQYYQRAMGLYRQQRFDEARDMFKTVQDYRADYKLTNMYIKLIDHQIDQRKKDDHARRQKVQVRTMQLENRMEADSRDIKELNVLIDGYAGIMKQAEADRDARRAADDGEALQGVDNSADQQADRINKDTRRVYENLRKTRARKELALRSAVLEVRVLEKMISMMDKAAAYNAEVLSLVQHWKYAEAEKKFDEFQEVMLADMNELERSAAVRKGSIDPAEGFAKRGALSRDPGYQRAENIVFAMAVRLFDTKDYDEARSMFCELAAQGNEKAAQYIRKIDQIQKKQAQ